MRPDGVNLNEMFTDADNQGGNLAAISGPLCFSACPTPDSPIGRRSCRSLRKLC
jgi:hypothetical protein